MIKVYTKFIQQLAKKYIAKHQPIIVGVTGSAGKSSAVAGIGSVLTSLLSDQKVYFPSKQLNGELGMPLTVFQIEYFGPTIIYLVKTTWNILRQYISQNKPYDIIVLEYGVDHVGEMDDLLSIAKPDFSIITNIDKVHFGDPLITGSEKTKLIQAVRQHSYMSVDDEYGSFYAKTCPSCSSFSLSRQADIVIESYSYSLTGIDATILLSDKCFYSQLLSVSFNSIEIFYAMYVAIGYDIALRLGASPVSSLVMSLNLPSSRANLLSGINHSVIIDSSYNSSPVGTLHMLTVLDGLKQVYPDYGVICLIGEMRELYDLTESSHKGLAEQLILGGYDYIGLVGISTRDYMLPLLQVTYGDHVYYSDNSIDLGKRVRDILVQEDKKYIIFVKGSQNTIYLEEAIKEFLLSSSDVSQLCRQSDRRMIKKDKWFSQFN